jgi:hypothetical protein
MGYQQDLSKISLTEYRDRLQKADLVPSRKVIQEELNARFKKLGQQGIQTLEELRLILNSKKKLQTLAENSGIPGDYLTLLGREIRSILRKPNKIRDFPEMKEEVVIALEKEGINNTQQLYPFILNPEKRTELAAKTGIDQKTILRLASLADLSRVRWVNHTFAFVLLETGYHSVKELAQADYPELHKRVNELNAKHRWFKGQIGLHDMKLTVASAREVEAEVAF